MARHSGTARSLDSIASAWWAWWAVLVCDAGTWCAMLACRTYAWFGGIYIPVVILMFSLAPRYIATAEMGSIKMLETVTTPFWVWIYDKELPNWTAVVGGSLIVIAIVGWSVASLRAARDSGDDGLPAPADDKQEDVAASSEKRP